MFETTMNLALLSVRREVGPLEGGLQMPRETSGDAVRGAMLS
jgi:hypothetical protein